MRFSKIFHAITKKRKPINVSSMLKETLSKKLVCRLTHIETKRRKLHSGFFKTLFKNGKFVKNLRQKLSESDCFVLFHAVKSVIMQYLELKMRIISTNT